jgi:hypothetical protein
VASPMPLEAPVTRMVLWVTPVMVDPFGFKLPGRPCFGGGLSG